MVLTSFLSEHKKLTLLLKICFSLLLILLLSNSVFAYPLHLTCRGTETEVSNISGKGERVDAVRSYTIEDRRIGSMNCNVWTDTNFICAGGNELIKQRTDGKGVYKQTVSIQVNINRISGAVKETVILNSMIKMGRATPADPYGNIFPRYQPYELIAVFDGICDRAEKRF